MEAGGDGSVGPDTAAGAAGDSNRLASGSFCSSPPQKDGTPCQAGSVCTQSSIWRLGVCIPVKTTLCASSDAFGVPDVCYPVSGCPATATGPCASKFVLVPLEGYSTSDYWGTLPVGGNQKFNVLVDTGSTTLALAASQCSGQCAGISPLYTPGSSAVGRGDRLGPQPSRRAAGGLPAGQGLGATVARGSVAAGLVRFYWALGLVDVVCADSRVDSVSAFCSSEPSGDPSLAW